MIRHCPLALESCIGELDFHCDYLQLGHVGDPFGVGHVHIYVHSIEHALEKERTENCSREKHQRTFQLEGS